MNAEVEFLKQVAHAQFEAMKREHAEALADLTDAMRKPAGVVGFDPTVPMDRQPMFVIREGDGSCREFHQWFGEANGCWCNWCDRLVVRLNGRGHRGRHRPGTLH